MNDRLEMIEQRLIELGIDISENQKPRKYGRHKLNPVTPLTVQHISKPSAITKVDDTLGFEVTTFIESGDEENPVSHYTQYVIIDGPLEDRTGKINPETLRGRLLNTGSYMYTWRDAEYNKSHKDNGGQYCRAMFVKHAPEPIS